MDSGSVGSIDHARIRSVQLVGAARAGKMRLVTEFDRVEMT